MAALNGISASAQEPPSNDAIFTFDGPDGAWWVHAINLPAAWQVTRGSPDVVIAIVDDGVQLNHEEYIGRIVQPASYFNDTGEMIEPKFEGKPPKSLRTVGRKGSYVYTVTTPSTPPVTNPNPAARRRLPTAARQGQ